MFTSVLSVGLFDYFFQTPRYELHPASPQDILLLAPFLIIAAILSWLAFGGVINTRNRFVYAVSDFLYRITEPALLAAKATRFPGQELRWDGANFRFTNLDKANAEILAPS